MGGPTFSLGFRPGWLRCHSDLPLRCFSPSVGRWHLHGVRGLVVRRAYWRGRAPAIVCRPADGVSEHMRSPRTAALLWRRQTPVCSACRVVTDRVVLVWCLALW